MNLKKNRMKTLPGIRLAALACALGSVVGANANLTFVQTVPVGLPVPDNDASGLVSSTTVAAPPSTILGVTVRLTIAGTGYGGWNGDLYAWLNHGNRLSVLLNRPGKSLVDPFGYSDNGLLDVILDDQAAGDIHTYQDSLGYPPGTLAGIWQPDGRLSDPDWVLPSDGRDALLGTFAGADPAGTWTLFVADLSGGGEFRLDAWELGIVAQPIPEPESAGVLVGALGLGAWLWRRRRR